MIRARPSSETQAGTSWPRSGAYTASTPAVATGREVVVDRPWVAVEVAGAVELDRVDEDRDDHDRRPAPRLRDQARGDRRASAPIVGTTAIVAPRRSAHLRPGAHRAGIAEHLHGREPTKPAPGGTRSGTDRGRRAAPPTVRALSTASVHAIANTSAAAANKPLSAAVRDAGSRTKVGSDSTSATLPVARPKIVSPSTSRCAGRIARANPSWADCASRPTSGRAQQRRRWRRRRSSCSSVGTSVASRRCDGDRPSPNGRRSTGAAGPGACTHGSPDIGVDRRIRPSSRPPALPP